jgi:hypothetical protein
MAPTAGQRLPDEMTGSITALHAGQGLPDTAAAVREFNLSSRAHEDDVSGLAGSGRCARPGFGRRSLRA